LCEEHQEGASPAAASSDPDLIPVMSQLWLRFYAILFPKRVMNIRLYASTVLIALSAIAGAGSAGAQGTHSVPSSADSYTLMKVASFFQSADSEGVEIRAGMKLRKVPDGQRTQFIRSDETQEALRRATIESLDKVLPVSSMKQRKETLSFYDLEYFRVGPYYAVLMRTNDQADKALHATLGGYSSLLIFRRVWPGREDEWDDGERGTENEHELGGRSLHYVGYLLM
jgi:hypothetical protein